MDQKVTVKMAADYFGYRMITGNEDALNREICVPDINRPGFELTGYFEHTQRSRVVIMGDKEISYIEGMSEERQRESFDFLTNEETPMILISRDHMCPPMLKEIAIEKNFPIFTSFAPTSSLMVEMVSYLEERMATSTSVHGELLSVYGVGLLLEGASGMGKSEIALELLKRGSILISDDRVDVARIHNKILGQAPDLLKDFLEIRGIGVINVVSIFGVTATMPKSEVNLVINLVPWNQSVDYPRVGNEKKEYEDFFGINIRKITLPVKEGRSMAAIIESAVIDFILFQRGINSPKEFENRIYKYIESKKGE